MGFWHDFKSMFTNPAAPQVTKRIVAMRGEMQPGFMELHVGTFDAQGKPTPDPGEVYQLPLTAAIRPSANRIMAGVETEEDVKVIELALQNMIK